MLYILVNPNVMLIEKTYILFITYYSPRGGERLKLNTSKLEFRHEEELEKKQSVPSQSINA